MLLLEPPGDCRMVTSDRITTKVDRGTWRPHYNGKFLNSAKVYVLGTGIATKGGTRTCPKSL